MYAYNSPGSALKKKLLLSRGVNEPALESTYTYNNEGQMVTTTYPLGGATYTYTLITPRQRYNQRLVYNSCVANYFGLPQLSNPRPDTTFPNPPF